MPDGAVEFAMHMATYGEHYEPYGYHVPPEVEKPQATRFLDVIIVDEQLSPLLIGLLPVEHLVYDRPPPLFASPSHGLRAPPLLIPA